MTPADIEVPGAAARHQLLDEAARLTVRMEEAAAGEHWAEVTELEVRRRAVLQACFADGPAFADRERARERVREILARDGRIMTAVRDARGAAGASLRQLDTGRQATAAYRRCQG